MAVLVEAMQMAEENPSAEVLGDLFRNLASDLIYFVLFQATNLFRFLQQ